MNETNYKIVGDPFRWGGITGKYDRTAAEWKYTRCEYCKATLKQDKPVYCGSFKDLELSKKAKANRYRYLILCRKCAYTLTGKCIEADGKTYENNLKGNTHDNSLIRY